VLLRLRHACEYGAARLGLALMLRLGHASACRLAGGVSALGFYLLRRRRRIAAGSGTDIHTINQLLTQFKQVQKMMKQLGSGRVPKNPFQMFGNSS